MCRWMAYKGSPALLYHLIFSPKHSLVVQSLKSLMGNEVTNGDGFGVGWYGPMHESMVPSVRINEPFSGTTTTPRLNPVTPPMRPALYRSVEPAWQDRNMKDLAQYIESTHVFAHVRAASPGVSTVQQTNCHPFRYGNWLWMHNGAIRNFQAIKRDMLFRIDGKYFPLIEGTTDSEAFFYLAMTFGLEDDPPTAVAKAVGWIIEHGRAAGAKFPIQMTVATTNGDQVWAFRFSSEGKSRSLYYSAGKEALMDSFSDPAILDCFDNESRFIVSEPMGDILDLWSPVPESTCVILKGDSLEMIPFEPIFEE